MSGPVEVSGVCPPRFAAVREAFAANFAEDRELGARFAAAIDGEIVIDLWAGWIDRAQTRPFGPDTLTPVFSTSKALAALLIARLVSQGRLAYGQPVAEVWPEFAQSGKAAITVEQCLSHQDGLAAFLEPIDPALWFDWDAVCADLQQCGRCGRQGPPPATTRSPMATSPAKSSGVSTDGAWAKPCARTSPGRSASTSGSVCRTPSTGASP